MSKGHLVSFITDILIEGEDFVININFGAQCIDYASRRYNLTRLAGIMSVY
jgi:hypothetical protein